MRWLTLALLVAAACDAGMVDGPTTTGFSKDDLPSFASGELGPLAGYKDIGGQAGMARQFGNETDLYISVTGLVPDTIYSAPQHVAACAPNAAAVSRS
jgi:hypothetical protein